jgi:hypothetical protein
MNMMWERPRLVGEFGRWIICDKPRLLGYFLPKELRVESGRFPMRPGTKYDWRARVWAGRMKILVLAFGEFGERFRFEREPARLVLRRVPVRRSNFSRS